MARGPTERWDNLQLGLRLGRRPRAVVTTTPRPLPLLQRLIARRGDGDDAAGGRATIRICRRAFVAAMDAPTAARGSAGRSWTAS